MKIPSSPPFEGRISVLQSQKCIKLPSDRDSFDNSNKENTGTMNIKSSDNLMRRKDSIYLEVKSTDQPS